jgi:phospholipid/cholesterol/gamma-HCH transport system substrate-binding protein
MKGPQFAVRVGLFVALGLVLISLLLLSFSKGLTLFSGTYELRLRSGTVGGLKDRASVMLAGVAIGNVVGAQVAPDGKSVVILTKIRNTYRIHADARVAIEQIGFLGDQYVAIYPTKNEAPLLKPGEEVIVDQPFSIERVVRGAEGLIEEASKTFKTLNEAVARANETVFSERTLTNVSAALINFRDISEQGKTLVQHVAVLIETNTPGLTQSISNLVQFSADVEVLAKEFREMVGTNRLEVDKIMHNAERTTHTLERLVQDVESGRGVVGSLFRDPALQGNLSNAVLNLTLLSSNLNKYGLLYKPKPKKEETTTLRTGKSVFN